MMPPEPPYERDPHEDELAERGRAIVAAAVAQTRAPAALRERVAAQAGRKRARARRRPVLSLAGVGAVVAAVLLVIALLPLGGSGDPSITAVAQAATRGATRAAPPVHESNRALLAEQEDGVAFPYWGGLEWEASGERTDTVHGRDTKTVYYDSPYGARLDYTIVSGGGLKLPAGGTTRTLHGVDLHVYRHGRRQIVVWQRQGHTCVMTAPRSVPTTRMLTLAAWDGDGQGDVSF